eukprot:794779-Prorocentrum_minimum.AAC.5
MHTTDLLTHLREACLYRSSYVLLGSRAQGESSGRKWGTGHRVRKGEGSLGLLSAPLPLLAQEDP